MKKIILSIAALTLFATGCASTTPPPTASTGNQNNQTDPTANAAPVKFADQSYYGNSYLISTDNLSADAQTALSGFQVSKKINPDGTIEYDLKASDPQYHDQQYILKPGEQLYFIDKMFLDDGNGERVISDDTAVVVDGQGNVVQAPRDWSN